METFILTIIFLKFILFFVITLNILKLKRPARKTNIDLSSALDNLDYRGTNKDARVDIMNINAKVPFSVN